MLHAIKDSHVRLVQVIDAIANIAIKWLMGVVVYKLLNESIISSPVEPSQSLLRFVFLFDLSFYWTVLLSIYVNIVAVVMAALLQSWAVINAAAAGRQLRSEILEKAVTESVGMDGADISRTATDLIVKVETIERFKQFDEHWLLVDKMVIALAFTLTMVFAWFAGVVAIASFILALVAAILFDKMRKEPLIAIEENATQTNARLLDIIKNGVKIKIMDYLSNEREALTELEEACDDHRKREASVKFHREVFHQIFIVMIPVVMALVAWHIISNTSNTADAIDISCSILVATLLMDEFHKKFLSLTFLNEKKAVSDNAKLAIDRFLGKAQAGSHAYLAGEKRQGDVEKPTGPKDSNADVEKGYTVKSNDSHPDQHWSRNSDHGGDEVVLTRVVQRFSGRDQPILNNYTQAFARGKIHALTGESGSGKTTALKVIADLIHPQNGIIGYWKNMKVAYVSQDQKLFARTIRENISYGAEKAVSDEDIWAALKTANIDDWVRSLPADLEEVLPGGEGVVSGGQLQRLNLAHLFCTCQDADLVLLDEVLSSLDETSRDLVMGRLEIFLKGKTAIIITHHSEMLQICEVVHEMPSPESFAQMGRPQREEKISLSLSLSL